MYPYEGVAALQRAAEELDDVVAQLGGMRPSFWRGPAARAFDAAREDLVVHAVTARAQVLAAERVMQQFAVEASTP